MTLQQVADFVGTTPQTVQRLETANMTVSMDWLSRLASALGVAPSALIADETSRLIPLIAHLGRDGAGRLPSQETAQEVVMLDVAAEDPVAVHLEERIGDYAAGSYLICNRFFGADIVNAHGADCIAKLAGGGLVLRRLIWQAGAVILVPLDQSGDVRFDAQPEWAARIVMQLRYF
jgi:transcriptional regulator with XRE-family HTH domain